MGLKRTIIAIKWFPSHVINLLTLRLRKINCGKRLSTHGTLFVRGTGTITIGENVSITSCRETNPIGGDVKTILFAKNNATITIGDNTGISNSALVAVDSIAIGNNVLSTDSDILSTNECYFLAPFIQESLKYLFITIADREIRFIKHNPSPINNSYFFFLYNIRSVNPHETGCW